MIRLFQWLFPAITSALLLGCADTQPQNTNDQGQVSSIPWNRPEKWEGQGMMNGMGTP